ncbi:MAG: hypothetical protein LBM98_10355 [Oscillospiraceae bacterium]|nr:hypothetical protein [Oscillospiraceae bacterium]
MRYVGRIGAKQSSAGSVTYVSTYRRIVRQPWIASPHIIGTYRKCGGGFAKTGRASPAPRCARLSARCAAVAAGRGYRRRAGQAPPLQIGASRHDTTRKRGGFETRPLRFFPRPPQGVPTS